MSAASGPTAARSALDAAASARVGFVGAGQLARMTHRAAIDLGVSLSVLATAPDEPAVLAGATAVLGAPDDPAALASLAEAVDVVTLDHELVDGGHLTALLEAGHLVRPGPATLRFAQDKLYARRQLAARGFPTPAFAEVGGVDEVEAFAADHGWPVVLKARSGGYDGRGVVVAPDAAEAGEVLAAGGEWLVEEHVALATELAVVLARGPDGGHVTYPVVETVQDDGICVELVMPARVDARLAAAAEELAVGVAGAIDAVGILAVELFVDTAGRLSVNEVAVRPHNSGHATIEGSDTSQFHNHLRAVLGWPLGSTRMRVPVAATVNLLGGEAATSLAERLPRALADDRVHPHLYGKAWRPGRKLGHVTVLADDPDTALAAARRAAATLMDP